MLEDSSKKEQESVSRSCRSSLLFSYPGAPPRSNHMPQGKEETPVSAIGFLDSYFAESRKPKDRT